MNNETKEKYLPIGTVVLLKNGVKRIMINGYLAVSSEEQNIIYDYCGVLFPEGLLSDNQKLLFNHEQILKIEYLGLVDQEQQNFNNKLKTIK